MKVRVPESWWGKTIPATEVEIDGDGAVTWQGKRIGYVWKGHRTYSPPLYRGSRIVRYHKRVPEWHGHPTTRNPRPRYRDDTRQRVLQRLIADATRDD